ncbi:P antigen family member 3-like [Ailuropoda melanoleuca]|uniref:P antigen family member 3-like n=1 Tax=Ailuropoda melanoleuca TaxID=9646 RepID=UPI001494C470|nr:P antigen family member 3-like [Ailuropoda melanoleuca]
MSGRVRSRSKSNQRKDDRGSNQHVAEQQPSDEHPKQKEVPPCEFVFMGNMAGSVGPEMKADLQELVQSKTGDKSKDAPDVKGASLPNLEPIKIPEADLMALCTVASGPYAWKGRKAGYMENVDSPGTLPPTTSSATLVRVCHLLNLSFPICQRDQ